MRIRGGSGLGDSIYVRPIVDHYVRTMKRKDIVVCSNYPDVFIGSGAEVAPFSKISIHVLAHYTRGKANPNTTQWDDVCSSAGIKGVRLNIDWQVRNPSMVEGIRKLADKRPIVLVHGGRSPMGRTDGFGAELLPKKEAFDAVLSGLSDCFLVRIGAGPSIYDVRCDLDLTNETTVSDLLDLGSTCDAVVAQCSFAVPLAEVFDKLLIAVWANSGLHRGRQAYIRQITPQKILSKRTSWFVVDHWTREQIQQEVQGVRILC